MRLLTSPADPASFLDLILNDPGRLFGLAGSHALQLLQRGLPLLGPTVSVSVAAAVAVGVARQRRSRSVRRGARYLRILPPPDVDPDGAMTVWMGLHGLLRPAWARLLFGQPHLAWEVFATGAEAAVGLWVPGKTPPGLAEQAIQSAWPGASVQEVLAPQLDPKLKVSACELRLAEPEEYPLGPGAGGDPLRLVLGALSLLSGPEQALIQVLARPATSAKRHHIRGAARALRRNQAPRPGANGRPTPRTPDPTVDEDIRTILQKGAYPMWEVVIRLAVSSGSRQAARGNIHSLAGGFDVFSGPNYLVRTGVRGGTKALATRSMPRSFVLSAQELAMIACLPSAEALPALERARARTVAPPRELARKGKPLGKADHPGYGRPVAITPEDASQHIHLVGETGTGKSTLIAQMVLADAAEGRAAVVIDPKGDLVTSIAQRLPADAIGRTCFFDPDDTEWAVGLNVLAGEDPDLVVDQVVSVFKRIYADAWGARSDDIMRCACLTLTQIPGSTLADVGALLTNDEFRAQVRNNPDQFKKIGDLSLFWEWYEQLGNQRATNIGPLMNKLRAFLLRGPVRAIVGQADPKLVVGHLIDNKGLLLVRIPKGTIGEETSRVLGAFVVARVWQACMQRAGRDQSERPPVSLYVDEMHNYLALPRSFEDMLAEARGYGLGMILAHQHMGQLTRDVRDALAANARTKIVFATSPDDASLLSRHFAPQLTDYDLANLAAFQGACRPCLGGAHGPAFTFKTEALAPEIEGRYNEVKAATARNFAVSRSEIDTRLRKKGGQLVDQSVAQSVKQSVAHSRLDQQPVPVLPGKRP